MYQYGYIDNNDNTNYFLKNSPITELKDTSLSNLYKLEQDIFSLINFLRKNPHEFCNNIIQKNKYKANPGQNEIINFLQEIHSKKILKPFIEIRELSLASRSLLNKIIFHYKKNHCLNMKELEPSKKNLRARLTKYGERTGKIFETVLFELDTPEEIVNHILLEEKGRNMLLSQEMKFIGISCDLIDENLTCTVIDIVQDFCPYKSTNNINNINNNINNNIYMMYNNNSENNNYKFNKSNYSKLKQNYYYNQNNYLNNNTEYLSLFENLSNKNNKDNLKLKILQRKKTSEIPMNIRMDINLNDNYNMTNNNIQINLNEGKNIYYKTPKKYQFFDFKNNKEIFSPKIGNANNNINIKKALPKRMNSSNINTVKIDLNNENQSDVNNIKDIKFTMAGRTTSEQQNIIIDISKKNMNKSKSVCSFDAASLNSKKSGKNKFQRLNHEEKMEILHKINNRNMKTPNSKTPNNKNSENITFIQKKESNNENKSPSSINFNQQLLKINQNLEKNNLYNNNNYNDFINKTSKNYNNNDIDNYQNSDGIRSQGEIETNNEEYSRKKINEIKNDIKSQLKEELKKEVREEIRNEFNKKFLYEKKQINEPIYFNLDNDFIINKNNIKINNFIQSNKKILPNKNKPEINKNQNINNNNNNKNIYFNKNKSKCSSMEKYYYVKNNNQKQNLNNTNKINNNNLFIPNNKNQYDQYNKKNKNIYYKGRKSFDWREFVPNNKSNNNDILLAQKCQQKLKKSIYQVENINFNNDKDILEDNFIDNTSRGTHISKQNIYNENENKNPNISYLNQLYKPKSKQEIKKLIRMYNMAQDDKRNKNINMNDSSSYNIINNNKSINDVLINDIEMSPNNIIIDMNDNQKSSSKKLKNNTNDKSNNKTDQTVIKNIFKPNNRNSKKLNDKSINSNDNFVEGHRFQIKYEKVKSKSQMYKEIIPKKRHFSMNKINENIDENIINNNKCFIDEISSHRSNNINKNEDIVKIENSIISNQNIINNEKNEEQINKSNDKMMKTGRFVDIDLINSNEIMPDIKNYIDDNTFYQESKEKPIISKTEKIEGNSIITTIITRTKKVYTPDKKNNEQNQNRTKMKNENNNQSSKIKNDINMKDLNNFENNMNESRSVTNQNNNSIKTKKISLKMKTPERNINTCKTPIQKEINSYSNSGFDFSEYSNNTENLEKKYIKDPEGNLVETFVKKTKYKNGSILLEYV